MKAIVAKNTVSVIPDGINNVHGRATVPLRRGRKY